MCFFIFLFAITEVRKDKEKESKHVSLFFFYLHMLLFTNDSILSSKFSLVLKLYLIYKCHELTKY